MNKVHNRSTCTATWMWLPVATPSSCLVIHRLVDSLGAQLGSTGKL